MEDEEETSLASSDEVDRLFGPIPVENVSSEHEDLSAVQEGDSSEDEEVSVVQEGDSSWAVTQNQWYVFQINDFGYLSYKVGRPIY